MSSHPILLFIVWCLGISLGVIGILFYITEKMAGEYAWRNLYIFMIILVILLGLPVVTNQIDPKNAQNIINMYITVDIAILSVTFAIMAIQPCSVVSALKNKSSEVRAALEPAKAKAVFENDIERFKGFIIITAFMMLLSIFVDVFTILSNDSPLLHITYYGITVYVFSTIFWVLTFFVIIAVVNLIYYSSLIMDEIFKALKNPESKKE